jgi:hypothetical protein
MPAIEDPLITDARREALWVVLLWASALVYTLTYCYWFGYQRNVETMQFVLWFPDWVFWGVIVPWCVCTLVSAWFAMFYMHDADLGSDSSDVGDSTHA